MCFLSVCAPLSSGGNGQEDWPPWSCCLGGVDTGRSRVDGPFLVKAIKKRGGGLRGGPLALDAERLDPLVRDVLLVAVHLHRSDHGAVGVHDRRGDRCHARHTFTVGMGGEPARAAFGDPAGVGERRR